MAAPFLFFWGPGPTSPLSYQAAWNLGHILFFALLTIWLHQVLTSLHTRPRLARFLFFSCSVLILGLVIEWVQYGFDRDPDWHDIWRNQLGACLAWFFLDRRVRLARSIFGLLCLLLVWEIFLVGRVVWVDWKIQNQIPLLSALETESDLNQWTGKVSLSQEVAARGQSSLKVQLTTDLYSGTGLKHLPGDWRGYQSLEFEIFNPEQEKLRLTLRINDKIHDQEGHRYDNRFNKPLIVDPGWNHFEISLEEILNAPSSRKMDMREVSHLGIFASQLQHPIVIYLDYFRLE